MMANCGIKTNSEGIPIPILNFGGITGNLAVYSLVYMIGLITYFIRARKCWTKFDKETQLSGAVPSLYQLYSGQADNWLLKERGLCVLQYTIFQRCLCALTVILFLPSAISLGLNLSNTDRVTDIFHRTASINLPKDSPYLWFSVLASALCPWITLFLLLIMKKKIGKLKANTSSYNRTLLLLQSGNEKEISDGYSSKYPDCNIIRINFGYATQKLQGTLNNVQYEKRVLQILEIEGKQESSWWQKLVSCSQERGRTYHIDKVLGYMRQLKEINRKILEGKPCITFLTFSSHTEAQKVEKRERNKQFSMCRNIPTFAPLPDEIMWNNIRSVRQRWLGWIICYLILFFLVVICSTPAGFAQRIQTFLGEAKWLQQLSSFLPPLLLLLFGLAVPFTVKKATVDYGHPTMNITHPAYQVRLYFWVIFSSLILPLLIVGGGNLIDLAKDVDSGGLQWWLNRWQCAFNIDTGVFYINFLIVVALLKGTFRLHRFSDLCAECYSSFLHCYSPAEVQAAIDIAKERNHNRNGSSLSLADDYVSLVVNTTILFFFCFSVPLMLPIYGLYIVTGHLVDLHNWRLFYHAKFNQPELLITASKLLLLASFFPQMNTTIFVVIRGEGEDNSLLPMSASLSLFSLNCILLLLYHISGWRLPTPLFVHRDKPRYQKRDGQDYVDDYSDPCMDLDILPPYLRYQFND